MTAWLSGRGCVDLGRQRNSPTARYGPNGGCARYRRPATVVLQTNSLLSSGTVGLSIQGRHAHLVMRSPVGPSLCVRKAAARIARRLEDERQVPEGAPVCARVSEL